MANIVRRDPFRLRDFARMRQTFDHMFDDAFPRWPSRDWNAGTIPVDVSERDGDLVVRASLPGFDRDEVDAQLHDGVLTITAKRDDQHEQTGERFYHRERRSGSVSRRIALPGVANGADINAELKDGVLTLTVPTPEERRPKRIEIKAA